MSKELGKIRQSNVIMSYGPGAIIDFRAPGSGASISVIAGALEHWVEQMHTAIEEAGKRHFADFTFQYLKEKRLAEKLKVKGFRLPPVAPDKKSGQNKNDIIVPLAGIRFPIWLQCPQCHVIQPTRRWGNNPGDPERFCASCSTKNEKAYVVPVRFVIACRNGHIADFPWSEWVHKKPGCTNHEKFRLEATGPGLAGLTLTCDQCETSVSMEQIFTKDAHKGRKCPGLRPWLGRESEECEQKPVTLQRGASNLYFPNIESALSIPPWDREIIIRLGEHWDNIEDLESSEDRSRYIKLCWKKIAEAIDNKNIDQDTFISMVEEKITEAERASSGNLRWDEYRQFMFYNVSSSQDRGELDLRHEPSPPKIPVIERLMRVPALREVRVLKSFTRIEALPGSPPVKSQYLSKTNLGWLPAIEVRGEGIFFSMDMESIKTWEKKRAVCERASKILTFESSRVLNPDNIAVSIDPSLGARYLLLHSLAHILMKQLSLQCGYSSASLRERLYVGCGETDMAGVMIYTATSDSDGTMGGLQRQGRTDLFENMFLEALRANEWCSSDPLCIKGLASATESTSLAACHSCLLAPETSCEDFNRFLDRAMIVGIPEDRSIGFFSSFSQEEN